MGMTFSDRLIYTALQELIDSRGEDAIISQREIADYSGVSLRTSQRALWRLERQAAITRQFTIGIGYTYRINNGSYPPAARRAAAPRSA